MLATETHPFPSVRVAIAEALLELLGVDLKSDKDLRKVIAAGRAASPTSSPFIKRARLVAEILLDEPLSALGSGTLRDLAPAVDREHALVVSVARTLARAKSLKTVRGLEDVPMRLLPSVARLAVAFGVDAAALTTLFVEHVKKRPKDVAAQFGATAFAQSMTALVAPLVDEARGGLKRAPNALFDPAQRISYVGATNDSLPKLFDEYAALSRKRAPKKELIEIFFLTDAAVRGLHCRTRSPDETAELRKQTLRALKSALLDSIAKEWRILEHDQPYFFAAYYDAEKERGRIHVSAAGWGMDIRRSPSRDELWPLAVKEPSVTYRWHLDALDGLRRIARPIALSDS
jgi:hypothetical protein